MKNLFVLVFLLLAPCMAFAGGKCDAPVADWKPREALREQLERQGWHVKSITADDGCYHAIGVDPSGHAFDVLFDPRTLVRADAAQEVPKS